MELDARMASSAATGKELGQGCPSDCALLVGGVQMPQRTTESILNLSSRVTGDGGVTETV